MWRLSTALLVAFLTVLSTSTAQDKDTTDTPPDVINPPPDPSDTTYTTPGPELIGGLDSLNEKVRYPNQALEECVEGRLSVLLTVEPNGSVSEVEVPEDWAASEMYLSYEEAARYGMVEEAVRVAKQAHFYWPEDWPDDREDRLRVSLPITFQPPEGHCRE